MLSLTVSWVFARLALCRRFQLLYLWLATLFTGLTIALSSWQWQQPSPYTNGLPYPLLITRCAVASVLSNSIFFYFQNHYIRPLRQQAQIKR